MPWAYRTCSRCGQRTHYTNLCLNCLRGVHRWHGTSHLSTCWACGLERRKERRRMKGDRGSTWKTYYGGALVPAPPCPGAPR